MDEETSQQIDNYYKLKGLYEKRINDKKKSIIRNASLSPKEKRQKFMQLIPTCVNCKKPGGTTFKIISDDEKNGPFLVAICGAKKPCSLNMKIDRGRWYNMRIYEEKASLKVKDLQTEIIETKLELLFNYVDESKALENFEEIKKELKQWHNSLVELRRKYISITRNSDTIKELNIMNKTLLDFKKELENIKTKYNIEKKPELIRDMVELYISQIRPLVNDMRDIKYKYSGIETDKEDNKHLVQLPYTLPELYVQK